MSAFDAYGSRYVETVQNSIAFSGLKHDLFVRAKVVALAELFGRHFGSAPPALLDVGCGVGAMHPHLRAITAALSGCDLSAASLAAARGANPGIEYRGQAAGTLPWPQAAFDAALAVGVFHHVPPPERAPLVAEMRRVTRPGGLVVLIEHNPWNPLTRLAVARCPFDDDAVLLGAREARALLKRGGFGAVQSRHFLVLPATGPWVTALERPLRPFPVGAQYLAFGRT